MIHGVDTRILVQQPASNGTEKVQQVRGSLLHRRHHAAVPLEDVDRLLGALFGSAGSVDMVAEHQEERPAAVITAFRTFATRNSLSSVLGHVSTGRLRLSNQTVE